MNCPYCNKEMRKGYVAGLSILTFSEEYRKIKLNPKKGEIVISSNTGSIAHKTSWYCDNCKVIFMRNISEPEEKTKMLFSGVDEDC